MTAQESAGYIRSPGRVTWSVWKALFLREIIARLTASRGAWLWMLLEPVAHVAILMLIFAFIRQREPFGVPGPMFIMTGVLTFFMMRNAFTRCTDAVTANAHVCGVILYTGPPGPRCDPGGRHDGSAPAPE